MPVDGHITLRAASGKTQ